MFDKVASCVSHLSCVVLWVCGQTAWGKKRKGWVSHGQQKVDWWNWCLIFQSHLSVVWRFAARLVHTRHQLSRWCPATVVSQIACYSTLTLSWSRGEKRCCTSLGPCWWRAARPIRRRGVSYHVTASPIAIYFTIGQMRRLILTICSLMCFSLSFTLSVSRSCSHTFICLSFSTLTPPLAGNSWHKPRQKMWNHLLCWVTFQDTINGGNLVDR